MTAPSDLHVVRVEQTDPRLGRQVVHDPRSRNFAFTRAVDLPRRSFRWRVYHPTPHPNQRVGCCTGVDQCVKANTMGNRVRGTVLNMTVAEEIYSRATQLDPWRGEWPPNDTGSSGLAACKAAKERGLIDRYEWIFNGVGGVLTALQQGPVGIGGRWDNNMFDVDPETGLVRLGGGMAGGHQWSGIGYNKPLDALEGLCWWGRWGVLRRGIFRIKLADLADLLADDGDAHITVRTGRNG